MKRWERYGQGRLAGQGGVPSPQVRGLSALSAEYFGPCLSLLPSSVGPRTLTKLLNFLYSRYR